VNDYVKAFLAVYYPNSKALMDDRGEDIKAWWDAINAMPAGPETAGEDEKKKYGYKLPKFEEGKALELVTEYITHMIFGVTADHEAYGACQQYFTTPKGLNTKIWNETVKENRLDPCGQVMQDCQTYLQALGVIAGTGVPMPRLLAGWSHLIRVQKEDLKLYRAPRSEAKPMEEGRRLSRGVTGEENQTTIIKFTQEQIDFLKNYFWLEDQKKSREYLNMNIDKRVNPLDGYSGELDGKYSEHVHREAEPETGGRKKSAIEKIQDDVYNRLQEMLKEDRAISEIEHADLLMSIHHAFMKDLIELNKEIEKKNNDKEQRAHPFDSYNPENMECSVSI